MVCLSQLTCKIVSYNERCISLKNAVHLAWKLNLDPLDYHATGESKLQYLRWAFL
jgi:hypothetical protein